MVIGHLDRFSSGSIFGWIGSFTGETLPFVTANGKPCQIRLGNLSRPDVESLRVCRRLTFLRELAYEKETRIFP